MTRRWFALVFAFVAFAPNFACAAAHGCGAQVPWLRSDTDAFARAKAEHRFVLLYLEAVWCHWCHVMDERTYGDAAIRKEIAAHYVPLRIDQDLRPDLSNRYKDYGWPATVVFAPDGTEIVKRQGFVAPDRFLKLLRAIVADPSPETVAEADVEPTAHNGPLADAMRAELIRRHRDSDDAALGGLKLPQKFLDADSVEYALVAGKRGDADEVAIARRTLDASRDLIDPTWGGVYQYSVNGDWKHPHYEKLALEQARYLRLYGLAFAIQQREEDRTAFESVRRYVTGFLTSPDGAFYVSQDADLKPGEHSDDYFALDDKARRARGLPRIDTHLYSLQNGQLIEALAQWSELAGDAKALADARRAADWILANRALPDGGFRHDEHDAAGPYLGDNLAMGRAFLALYRASGERVWLDRATKTGHFIDAQLRAPNGGYLSAKASGPIPPARRSEENISLARFANLLSRYSGDKDARAMADRAFAYVARRDVALATLTEPGVLLADDELARDPLHLTVIGPKSDDAARGLFDAVARLPDAYKRIEWWDKAEGPLPNPDIAYPPVKRAAAFVCTESRCSLPIYAPNDVATFLARDGHASAE